MFRRRTRPHLAPLDGATAERLLQRTPIDDAPDSCQRVAALLAIVTRPPLHSEVRGEAAAAAAFVAAHDVATRPTPRRTWSAGAVAATTVLLAGSVGAAVAAIEGALPTPVQAVAHETLGVVGIVVPGIAPEHPDPLIDRR